MSLHQWENQDVVSGGTDLRVLGILQELLTNFTWSLKTHQSNYWAFVCLIFTKKIIIIKKENRISLWNTTGSVPTDKLDSHVCFLEEVQQHPLCSHLGKVQRVIQSIPKCNELWDLLKCTILICLNNVF